MKESDEPQIFWGELAPSDHLVQFYDQEPGFLDELTKFICAGLRAREGVVVIATPAHRTRLHKLAAHYGVDLKAAAEDRSYIEVDAHDLLSQFMVKGSLDEARFRKVVADLLHKVGGKARRVRAFGEMVALLWENGMQGATLRLEHLWHKICKTEQLALFCAYPQIWLS